MRKYLGLIFYVFWDFCLHLNIMKVSRIEFVHLFVEQQLITQQQQVLTQKTLEIRITDNR